MHTLKLDKTIDSLDDIMAHPNLAEEYGKDDLGRIGSYCKETYDSDKTSRSNWEEKMIPVLKTAMQLYEPKTFPWLNACYSTDTEYLTEFGWKQIAEIKVGDKIYSRSTDGSAGYFPASRVFKHKVRELVHFNGMSIDLLVTLNHKMLTYTPEGNQYLDDARDFLVNKFSDRRIPLTSEWVGVKPEKVHGLPAKAYMRLLGWFLSEGHAQIGTQTYKVKSGAPRIPAFAGTVRGMLKLSPSLGSITIAQSLEANPDKVEIIKKDLEECGITYSYNGSKFVLFVDSLPRTLVEEFRSLGLQSIRRFPEHALSYSSPLLNDLLDTLILGDGVRHVREGRQEIVSYCSISEGLIDDIQILAQKIGLRATKSKLPFRDGMINGRPVIQKHQLWVIRINTKDCIKVSTLKREHIVFDEDIEVGCVEVNPHNTVFVRRNGKAVWCGNSNVKIPIITISGFQYHTRVYSLLIPGQDVVRLTYYGDDSDGHKSEVASRIAEHMNYQILEQDNEWEPNTDLTFLVQGIMGCAFKKVMFSAEEGYPISRYVSPWDLVVPYYTQSLGRAVRISHRLSFTRNDCYEREVRGVFLPVEGDPTQYIDSLDKIEQIRRETYGGSGDRDYEAPYDVIEQHRFLDLDNDGYAEPYTVTFIHSTGQVLRINARFFDEDVQYKRNDATSSKKKIYRITPQTQFVKYPFIPSIDGCFYDTGYGSILGGLSGAIDSNVNQLLDAGTLNNLGGGFISRGLVIRTGNYRFMPGEYKVVDATGASMQEGIRDLPVRQPSEVLLELVQILLQYADRVAGSTDPQQGENPGQNTPRGNYVDMLEEGGKIFKGLFKRTHRAFREEMRLLFKLNSLYLSDSPSYFNSLNLNKEMPISRMDYLSNEFIIRPSADPEVGSDAMKFFMAQSLNELADNSEGFDQYQVKRRFLKTMRISNIDEIYPPPEMQVPAEPPPPDPRIQVAEIRAQVDAQKLQMESKIEIMKLMFDKEIAQIRAAATEARGALALSQSDMAVGGAQTGRNLEEMNRIQDENRRQEGGDGAESRKRGGTITPGARETQVPIKAGPVEGGMSEEGEIDREELE